MNFLQEEKIPLLLNALRQSEFKVFVPTENEKGASCFSEWTGKEMLLLHEQTFYSPKKALLPQKQKLFDFKKDGKQTRAEHLFSYQKKIVFGIRPCDLNAVLVNDSVFLHFGTNDSFYEHNRKHVLFIAMQCTKAGENCFCTSLGTSKPKGFDLLLTPMENGFFVEGGSTAGKNILKQFSAFFSETRQKKPLHKIVCKNSIPKKDWHLLLEKQWNNPVWKRTAERCLSCGSCTQICPTCFCFMVDDYFNDFSLQNSSRYRQLDSCFFPQFSRVAGGMVFREARDARLKQFVNHKYNFFPKNHGLIGCVGCGRCISACPTKISIVEILNATARGKKVKKA